MSFRRTESPGQTDAVSEDAPDCLVLQLLIVMMMMMMNPPVVRLFLLLTSLTGVCAWRPQETYVREGEMVALQCPQNRRRSAPDAKLIWTSFTTDEMEITSNVSSAELRRMGVLVHEQTLVILNASINHQGNYSCSQGKTSRQTWIRLTVETPQSVNKERSRYSQTCYTQESCILRCPDENIPGLNAMNITNNGVVWHKESLPENGYFPNVTESDHGVYTCTMSYLYHSQTYKRTYTVALTVQQKDKSDKSSTINSPRMGDKFLVDLGSPLVIDCKAVVYSSPSSLFIDEVFWLSGSSSVERDNNLTVFYNYTEEESNEEIKITASLVFKSVSKEDLTKNYTCKLESVSQLSSLVTITLVQKVRRSYVPLALGVVVVVVMMVITVVIYVKFKMDIALFLRDTLGCHSSTSDGKSYDAFLMCYESDNDAGLNEDDRKWLESVLEERLGYSLCLYDRDVLPGKAVADVVLDCIEQSRTLVLVPTFPDPGPGSGLLSAIHEALVERQTRLVFIKTDTTEVSRSGSLPEALQLLADAGDCVTWKGVSSMPSSSSFWKQLRYYLPAPQRAPRTLS